MEKEEQQETKEEQLSLDFNSGKVIVEEDDGDPE